MDTDWSKAPKRPRPSPEARARIAAACRADSAARLYDVANLFAAERGISGNVPTHRYPAGHLPGASRSDPAEAAAIAAWAARYLPEIAGRRS